MFRHKSEQRKRRAYSHTPIRRRMNVELSFLTLVQIVLGVFLLTLLAGALLWGAGKRAQGMRQFCLDHGLEFRGRDNRVLSVLSPFVLGHRQLITHAIRSMAGSYQGVHLVILDVYETGLRDSFVTQTAICISSASLRLPRFLTVPHRMSHLVNGSSYSKRVLHENLLKLKRAICVDIDVSDCPELAIEYAVRGVDREAVRQLLTLKVIARLSNVKSLCVEGYENRLVVWREAHIVPVDKLEQSLGEAMSIYETFAS